jgi:putative heme iron utilization protein
MTPDPDFDPKKAAKTLLREGRSGALATLMPESGDPYCSLVNVATAADGAPLMLLSTLALHTKNILADPRASLMLDERKSGDPLEGARIMVMGRLNSVSAEADTALRVRYLAAHPDAAMFAGFADFALYRMAMERIHLVAGFGRIVDLPPQTVLTDLAGAEALVAAEADAVTHMNADHAEAVRLYATRLLGAPDGPWRCVACDPDGLDLELDLRPGRLIRRLVFPQRITGPGPLRAVLKSLAEQARAR